MGRMLQALKNLEARSAWPDARKNALAALAENAPAGAAPECPAAPLLGGTAAAAEFSISLLPPVQAERCVVVQPLPLVDAAVYSPVIIASTPLAEQTPVHSPAAIPQPIPQATQPAASPAAKVVRRPPAGLELAVRRALGEPHRREPIRELADRLRQDAQETGSRTLLFVGIGAASITHEAVLHVAALLADEGGRILLVDGDSARRPLTLELDAVQQTGLTDLISASEPVSQLLPTSFEGLTFLPAGTHTHSDLSNAGDRLSRRFGALASDHDLVLIDGGRSGDPAATTLARLADATYIVVQLGEVEASVAQAALRELRASGARVLGCIATE